MGKFTATVKHRFFVGVDHANSLAIGSWYLAYFDIKLEIREDIGSKRNFCDSERRSMVNFIDDGN